MNFFGNKSNDSWQWNEFIFFSPVVNNWTFRIITREGRIKFSSSLFMNKILMTTIRRTNLIIEQIYHQFCFRILEILKYYSHDYILNISTSKCFWMLLNQIVGCYCINSAAFQNEFKFKFIHFVNYQYIVWTVLLNN